MIKKIHYIWLGKKPKNSIILSCIKSWKEKMPDWEIVEWNESNLDLDCNSFCREAYDLGKYAFAADVLRFHILYNEGGLYFDTDVKMLKSFEELTEKYEAFSGFEEVTVAPGLVLYAKNPKYFMFRDVIDIYDRRMFRLEDGSLNLRTVGLIFGDVLANYGFKKENKLQTFYGFTVFPRTYFCPENIIGSRMDYSENTYSVHLYAASWCSKKYTLKIFFLKKIFSVFKIDIANLVRKLLKQLKYNG